MYQKLETDRKLDPIGFYQNIVGTVTPNVYTADVQRVKVIAKRQLQHYVA